MPNKLKFVDKGPMLSFDRLENSSLFRSSAMTGIEDTYMRVRDHSMLSNTAVSLSDGVLYVFPNTLEVIPLVIGQSIILEVV